MTGFTISGHPRRIESVVIPGGAAGEHAEIPGNLRAGDQLISVRHVSSDFVTNADLTAEFSIVAGKHGAIDNTAGTNSTGNFLIVTWSPAET